MFETEIVREIEQKQQEWEETTVKEYVKDFPEKEILSDIPRRRLYTPNDLVDFDYMKDLGFPGEEPFTRGKFPTMYRSRFWTEGLYSGYGRPEDANKRMKFLLAQGDNTVRIAYDLPTQLGYDSDHPLAVPEVGQIGVACSSLQDIEKLFDGIPMDRVPIMGSINNPHIVLWAMYVAAAEKQGIASQQLSGQVVSDFINEYIGRGTYIFQPPGCLRLSLDFMEYATQHIPDIIYEICAYSIREKGSTAVQEAAYAIATGLYLIESALERGMAVDDLRLYNWELHLATHMDFFDEVAKCRALRRLWARIVKERFNPANPDSLAVRLGPTSGGSTLTAQQAENNIVRVAIQLLATVLGGGNFTKTSCYDEAYAIPTPKSHRISLMTQHVVAYESGIADVVDPLGGSYYVESLTNDMEKRIVDYLKKLEEKGGLLKAIETGWFQADIARAAYKRQKEIDDGKRVIVGVNKFVVDEMPDFEIHHPDHTVAEDMKGRLARLRQERDSGKVRECLSAIEKAAGAKENLFPFVLSAVKNHATLGEICAIFREVFGEYQHNVKI
jgi:methylmalonyl-CoA mutase N-terminal domain/subunit